MTNLIYAYKKKDDDNNKNISDDQWGEDDPLEQNIV